MSRRPLTERMPPLLAMMWPILRGYGWRFALVALVLLPISAVMAMTVPYLTKVAIDEMIMPALAAGSMEGYLQPLVALITLALGVVLLGYISDALYVALLQRTGQRLVAQLREGVYRRTLRLPRSYFDRHPIGAILTRVTSDVDALGESLAPSMLSLVVDVLKAVAYIVMMFYLSWRLTLVLLVMIPVLVVLIRFFQVRVRRAFFLSRQALSEATGFLQECLSGIKTLQLYGAEAKAVAQFEGKNRRFYNAQNASNYYDALLFALVEGLTTLATALVLWYAAGALLAGTLSLGVLVAFMEYIQRLFVPVREFSQQLAVLQRAMAAVDHINGLCTVPLDPAEPGVDILTGLPLAGANGAAPAGTAGAAPVGSGALPAALPAVAEPFRTLEFDAVRFRYSSESPDILKGISFRVEQGQTLALVGATGSGKSTVIRLLTRAYGGYEGSIRINGRELNTLSAVELSAMVSVVHQGVFLYTGSVDFNIALERPGLAREHVARAAQYVQAHRFIEQLEGGYDFPIQQGGANLSAGQAQLIAFARAVAAETELIVLDEATASVDSLTEQLIQEAVGRIYQDKTVIAIAHRLSTIRTADTILVLAAGEIIESGNHETLIARGGAYAALVGEQEQTGAA